jgi:hypothetical protein
MPITAPGVTSRQGGLQSLLLMLLMLGAAEVVSNVL